MPAPDRLLIVLTTPEEAGELGKALEEMGNKVVVRQETRAEALRRMRESEDGFLLHQDITSMAFDFTRWVVAVGGGPALHWTTAQVHAKVKQHLESKRSVLDEDAAISKARQSLSLALGVAVAGDDLHGTAKASDGKWTVSFDKDGWRHTMEVDRVGSTTDLGKVRLR